MKNKLYLLRLVIPMLIAIVMIGVSCGDDPEPEPEAPAKDAFIGDYVGTVACPGIIGTLLEDPNLEFNITNTVPPADDMVQVNLPGFAVPLELIGTVSGNQINMSQDLDGVMAMGLTLNIQASGSASLSGPTLTAVIDINATTESGAALGTDKCTITATKQN